MRSRFLLSITLSLYQMISRLTGLLFGICQQLAFVIGMPTAGEASWGVFNDGERDAVEVQCRYFLRSYRLAKNYNCEVEAIFKRAFRNDAPPAPDAPPNRSAQPRNSRASALRTPAGRRRRDETRRSPPSGRRRCRCSRSCAPWR